MKHEGTKARRQGVGRGAVRGAVCLIAAGLGMGWGAGCRTEYVVDAGLPAYDERFAAVAQGEVLDVQVFRDRTKLRMTNTTGRDLPGGLLWLNARFSREVEALPAGETLEVPLREFRDGFGERFRAGGFWATREPDPVVLAQWEPTEGERAGERLGLVVVENRLR